METDADRSVDRAREDATNLTNALMNITKEWGWNDYNSEFKSKIRKAAMLSLEISDLLG